MTHLAKCPCGQVPDDVGIMDGGQGGKWAFVVPSCCGEWMLEFRTNYLDQGSEECKKLAIEAWNSGPRGDELKTKEREQETA